MTAPSVKGKGGRPRKKPDEGKRSKYACRMTDALRARVGAAAEEAGRSLSEEIEYRLEASFHVADMRQAIREEIEAALPRPAVPLFDALKLLDAQRNKAA